MSYRIIATKTYHQFAKKYKIPLSNNGIRKTIPQLQQEIYMYETMNKHLIKGRKLYYY